MIRDARRRDADLLADLQGEAFTEDPWPALGIMQLMANPGIQAFVAEPGGVPAGFALMRVAADEAEVIAIGVRPAQRRRGVGRVLLEEIVARAARAGAAPRPNAPRASTADPPTTSSRRPGVPYVMAAPRMSVVRPVVGRGRRRRSATPG